MLSETDVSRIGGGRMEVIGVGLGRTGTGSLKDALNLLGYKTFHMSELPKDLDRWAKVWTDTYKKIDDGTIARADWDTLYQDYTATTDFPSAMFPRELLAAYPSAKFILTTRPTEKCQRKIKAISRRFWVNFFRGRFVSDGKEIFNEHNQLCRDIIPKEQLLEFRVEEGWEPLCKFLEKPIPSAPFPFSNEGKEMAASLDSWEKNLWKQFIIYYVSPTICVAALGAAAFFNRNNRNTIISVLKEAQGWISS
ncbi:hypothetical protein NEOLEDRAFT_1244588 [Neolentinus lepideus HHB14362 ss-1]|uniref:P-loop containing nucleoside triphosphate hydrolase protein n=1 Tax=Neolentinus lepideus HHB14362 ss-1 TaxID=1314782 RepID=A0A165PQW0_9AGAM|nr:hypothetical protein NEOLEDRAFT_1244588 [Neolentinus lepideus HHB14362 ss-1]